MTLTLTLPAAADPTPGSAGGALQPAAPAGSGSSIADVVSLKDGSMTRGAIIEHVGSESVTLLLPNGTTRRFSLNEVSYAGPVASLPAAPAPPEPTVVHFKADEPLAFSVLRGTSLGSISGWRSNERLIIDHYDELCSAPCTSELKKGRYRFSLSRDGQTRPAAEEVTVSPGDTVIGRYESYSGMRWAGLAVMLGGTVAGLTYAIAGAGAGNETCAVGSSYSDFNACVQHDADNTEGQQHWAIGAAVALTSLLIGGALAIKQDEARVFVSAGITPLPVGLGASDRRALSLLQPGGLTFSARF